MGLFGRDKNEVGTQANFDEVKGFISELMRKQDERDRMFLEEFKRIKEMVSDVTHSQFQIESPRLHVDTEHNYMVDTVDKLSEEKTANEILATLFGNMQKPHPSRLRPFFTHLEQSAGVALSEFHRKRVEGLTNKGDGKYPYRKMDSILMKLDADYVYQEAKNYVFKRKGIK